ncbi:kynureninase [Thermosporothrix hazakensis]|uniref:Kynureninase n=2 Tax=Thermosporothrix TaxID=768650 RepID=A0A326UJG4_THEHA|nr:kynureninase [Thermosporothrix hazakensis]PZW29217.1 kynureninase [Thermosporothrix hazakensis]BBH86147.1 kynureninase [Thermosporothrix sp. COM3]GCE45431.1 kynureninase [Thermosporothrix hazakensis]
MTPFRLDEHYADELDRQDPLASFRERFHISDPDLIYLDGNSLGRLPKLAIERANRLVQQEWGESLIRGWNEEGWYTAPERVGAKIARLIGAQPDEVIVADSTSVNLFKLVVAALRLQQGRTHILTDNLNFPSDLYILQGAIELLGHQHHLDVLASPDGIHGPVTRLYDSLNEQTALVSLSHTAFISSFTYDMAEVTQAAHKAGSLVLWDLCHSVGAVPIKLNEANVDLAVGCTYKYVNGGPGAPAFLYIRRDLQDRLRNPLSGWWGQNHPFELGLNYEPASGLRRFLTGTPPILSLSLIEPGVDLLLECGIDALRARSIRQSEYLILLWEELLKPLGFTLNSPRDAGLRGSHVSLGHPEGLRIDQALIHEMKVLPDFRAPDTIRLGIAPLYTSYRDIHTAIMRLRQIVTERIYERYSTEPPSVT